MDRFKVTGASAMPLLARGGRPADEIIRDAFVTVATESVWK